jgi:dTMP kinase
VADGTLIVVEGIDGSGTTTQARLLVDWLIGAGRRGHLTREPSDGPVGRLIREILHGAHAPVDGPTMALLFAADRADHLAREMLPALATGAHVVTDRYYHSSLAYQAIEADREWVEELNRRARRPDVTLLLDLPAEEAARRRQAAGRPEERYDRLEAQARIAENYRGLARRLAGEDYRVLDGARTIAAVQEDLRRAVAPLLGLAAPGSRRWTSEP